MSTSPHTKSGLIAALKQLGALMELDGANAFRIRATLDSARILEGLEGDPAQWLADGRLEGMRGIGKGTLERIRQWVETGRLEDLDELCGRIPAGLTGLMNIPNLGTKKIQLLWKERGIDSVEKLEEACRAGTLAGLRFREKTICRISKGSSSAVRHERHLLTWRRGGAGDRRPARAAPRRRPH